MRKQNRSRRAAAACLALGSLAAAGTAAVPAYAATSGDTTVTFEITSGDLAVSVPANATLTVSGADVSRIASGPLGTVTVTDERASLVSNWTVTAAVSEFTNSTQAGADAISPTAATYIVGSLVELLGGGLGVAAFVGTGTITLAANSAESVATGVYSGSNQVSWNPTFTLPIPVSALSGTYTGTVTHSVS